MDIESNKKLQALNTLAVPGVAEYFCELENLNDLKSSVRWAKDKGKKIYVLGGGSNVVLPNFLEGLLIQAKFLGVGYSFQKEEVFVKSGAGVSWHELVSQCVSKGYYGIENLALIPGNVGAAPIQNIGAYGCELQDVFFQLEAFNIENETIEIFDVERCRFSYRDSIFKNELDGKYVIINVTLKLSTVANVNLAYPALSEYFKQNEKTDITPQKVFDAVVDIRQSKLPDPSDFPNAGSFFKNPIVEMAQLNRIKQHHPKVVYFPYGESQVKIAAAWLIDQRGWKGRATNGVMMHRDHALVLINTKKASSLEISKVVDMIKDDVEKHFGIILEQEPRVLGGDL